MHLSNPNIFLIYQVLPSFPIWTFILKYMTPTLKWDLKPLFNANIPSKDMLFTLDP